MEISAVLDLPLEENDADATTVRDYLKALLYELWREEEGFSGKRPFGNSGWQNDLYKPLVKFGVVSGKFDSDGYLDGCDCEAADRIILDCIEAM